MDKKLVMSVRVSIPLLDGPEFAVMTVDGAHLQACWACIRQVRSLMSVNSNVCRVEFWDIWDTGPDLWLASFYELSPAIPHELPGLSPASFDWDTLEIPDHARNGVDAVTLRVRGNDIVWHCGVRHTDALAETSPVGARLLLELAGREVATCANCGLVWPVDELERPVGILGRVQPGEVMPAGECGVCGALCHVD